MPVGDGAAAPLPMIEVVGLTKLYGAHAALAGVSLAVPRASVLTVLGPNGSGKTTLLRVLATLTRPTEGRGRIAGFDLVTDRDAVRRRIAVIGHGTQLYSDLTAVENLSFSAALADGPHDRGVLTAALARVGLEAVANVRVRGLSSGMQRRVALARAMLRAPEVLLLDEPFTGLDQESLKRFEDYLHTFRESGGTAVLVTHSLGRGLRLADRVAILAGGRLVADEPRERLSDETLRRLYVATTEEP
jgi:heme ABC exporter ATP-binding subunit CcmA